MVTEAELIEMNREAAEIAKEAPSFDRQLNGQN